jgi:hypothetical protein
MTAHLELPLAAEHALAGSRAARATIRAVREASSGPDLVLHDLLDAAAADGVAIDPTPRLRAFCRALQKYMEGRES